MHEYHLVERLVFQVVETAQENKAARVTRVTLVMGKSCGIDAEVLSLHFSQASRGTLAESAELIIKRRSQAKEDCYIEDIEVEPGR